MVTARHSLILFFVIFFLITNAGLASGQQRQFHIEHEWSEIWINQDGSIDLLNDISVTLDSGPDINYISIGQPQRDFTIGSAVDQYGNLLEANDVSSGSDYKVEVKLSRPLMAGQTVRFNLTTNVAKMIYEDTQNPGNVGMQFISTWWQEARVVDLRVLIILPPGVSQDKVKTTVNWDNVLSEDDRLAIYWERQSISPRQQFVSGVSFPKEFIQNYTSKPTGVTAFLQQYGPAFLVTAVAVGLIGTVVYKARKKSYSAPTVSIETLGVKRGLTAVEASYLLDVKPTKIVTEILYSLLQKRAVWVESTTPSVKLRIMQPFQNKTGTEDNPLRYYEIDFLNAVREDGTLEEEKLAQTVTYLRSSVEEKLRGYCRRDTVDYYRRIVDKAWDQVKKTDTAELASKIYDEQLLWLLLDPNYQSNTQTTFSDRDFDPSPLWWWYWYNYQHYFPNPTYRPNLEIPTQSAKPPAIPGADFANNIATAVEKTSNSIVANIEKFANAIVPIPASAKTSSKPARHDAGCVCACANCACVCACVSCACACAGGGVR